MPPAPTTPSPAPAPPRPPKVEYRNLPLPEGARLGRYTVIKKLAAGGFGVVYQASRADGEMVAIKEFLPTVLPCRLKNADDDVFIEDPEKRSRFQDGLTAFFREADVLSRLHLPHVVSIWDVFEARGTAYFAMPLESGMTLRHWVTRSVPRPDTNRIVTLMMAACEGVSRLHAEGLLHLDITPRNLWVRPGQEVLVLDLGASRWEDEEGRLSHLARTPGFAAPEQHGVGKTKNPLVLTPRTDVYGLAATLLYCLEPHVLPEATLRSRADAPLSRLLMGRHSPRLLDVIDWGLALTSSDRPASVLDWKRELGHCRPGTLRWGSAQDLRLQEVPPPPVVFSGY